MAQHALQTTARRRTLLSLPLPPEKANHLTNAVVAVRPPATSLIRASVPASTIAQKRYTIYALRGDTDLKADIP